MTAVYWLENYQSRYNLIYQNISKIGHRNKASNAYIPTWMLQVNLSNCKCTSRLADLTRPWHNEMAITLSKYWIGVAGVIKQLRELSLACLRKGSILLFSHWYKTSHSTSPHAINMVRRCYIVVTLLYYLWYGRGGNRSPGRILLHSRIWLFTWAKRCKAGHTTSVLLQSHNCFTTWAQSVKTLFT